MVDRYQDAISKQVGFDIRPDENFTFNNVIEKGLLKHTDLCEDIGERAYKKHHIDISLKMMKIDWQGKKF